MKSAGILWNGCFDPCSQHVLDSHCKLRDIPSSSLDASVWMPDSSAWFCHSALCIPPKNTAARSGLHCLMLRIWFVLAHPDSTTEGLTQLVWSCLYMQGPSQWKPLTLDSALSPKGQTGAPSLECGMILTSRWKRTLIPIFLSVCFAFSLFLSQKWAVHCGDVIRDCSPWTEPAGDAFKVHWRVMEYFVRNLPITVVCVRVNASSWFSSWEYAICMECHGHWSYSNPNAK